VSRQVSEAATMVSVEGTFPARERPAEWRSKPERVVAPRQAIKHKAWNSRHLRLVRKARRGPTTLRPVSQVLQRRLKSSLMRTVAENQMLLMKKYQPQLLWAQVRRSRQVSSLSAEMVFCTAWVSDVTSRMTTVRMNCSTMVVFSSPTNTSITS